MSTEPDRTFSYKSPWRRLRRRCYLIFPLWIMLLVGFAYSLPAFCMFAWLFRDRIGLGLVYFLGSLWFLRNLVFSLLCLFAWAQQRKGNEAPPPLPIGQVVVNSLGLALPTAMLLAGKMDLAVYAEFGCAILVSLFYFSWHGRAKAALVEMLLNVAILAAFAANAVWWLIPLLFLYFTKLHTYPWLPKHICKLPNRQEFVRRARAACAASGGCGPLHLLDTLCEAELWDEVLIELKRQSYVRQVKQQEAAWLAKIFLGRKQYEQVIGLEEQARRDVCDISPFLAIAYARLGQPERALSLAQEAVRVRRPGAERALGQVYFEKGDYERALLWYERAGQSLDSRDRGQALRSMGEALMALGDYREAGVMYTQAILLTNFVHTDNLLKLAECLRRTGRTRAAAEMEQLASEKAKPVLKIE